MIFLKNGIEIGLTAAAGLVAGVALLTLAVLVALVSLVLGIIANLIERATKGGAE